MTRVSVIVPAYNADCYLGECIQSILLQSFTDLEVIVVDDGSTDHTRQVVGEFTDPRVRYIYQENRGLSGARNTGIISASGDVIGLLDADDLWLPFYLETTLRLLDQYPDIAGVYTNFRYLVPDGSEISARWYSVSLKEDMYLALRRGNFINACSMLMRRQCYLDFGLFDETLCALEDWDMWLRISRERRLLGTNKELVLYRQHAHNMTKDLSRMRHAWLRLLDKSFGEAPGGLTTWSSDRKAAYVNLCLYEAVAQLGAGNHADSGRCLSELFLISPTAVQDVDLFYALACSHQPPYYRGLAKMLDWDRAESDLVRIAKLNLKRDSRLEFDSAQYFEMLSTTHYALGLLANFCHRPNDAIKHLVKAVKVSPNRLFDGRLLRIFLINFLRIGGSLA